MNLVNMKQDMSSDACCAPCPESAYPYGLRIYLNDDNCEALGVKGPITAGTVLTIAARVVVVGCHDTAEADGDDTGNDISLDLQITDMALGNPASIYPNSMMKE